MALPAPADARVPMRRGRAGVLGPRGGGVYLSRVQQTRLLNAAVAVVTEEGLRRLSARRVSARAGMSTKTFYDLFADSEDCFLAVFDRAVDQLAGTVGPVWVGEGEWVARVRGSLTVLLAVLERAPALGKVVFLEALGAGPRVLGRRAEVLDRVAVLLDQGRAGSPLAEVLPSLTAAGVAGAAFSIVHARLVEQRSESLMELVGPVMATVVLPYRGREVSAGELERPVPELPELPELPEFEGRVVSAEGVAQAGLVVGRARPTRRGKSAGAGRAAGPVGRRGVKHGGVRGGVLLPRMGGDGVEYRRALLLRAAAAAVDEHGYTAVTVAHITERAKISRRTFYELFVDREQCLLAVMGDIDAQLTNELQAADLGGLPWRERVRLGLWTVLRFFDREPGLARFYVVESARGDERMSAYRAELLARIVAVIAEGSEESLLGESSPLVAEGVAGAVVSILSTRLAATGGRAAGRSRKDVPFSGPLSDLLGELMGLIVLPYLGSGLAQEERARSAPTGPVLAALPVTAPGSKQGGKYLALDSAPTPAPHLRLTYRTALVLEAIAKTPGISNLGVARQAQINDQGQVSKMLSRLERHGLVQNTGRGQSRGAPNEWRLTPEGEKLEQGIREHARPDQERAA
jgi:AcrR family transcriptional regulator/DNA-binding MarR family transcriptional regulator